MVGIVKRTPSVRTQRKVPVLVCGLVTLPSLSCSKSRSSDSCSPGGGEGGARSPIGGGGEGGAATYAIIKSPSP